MKFLKLYEQFIRNVEPNNVPIEHQDIDEEEKIKTKEEVQNDEEEAIKRVAAGFLSNEPIAKE